MIVIRSSSSQLPTSSQLWQQRCNGVSALDKQDRHGGSRCQNRDRDRDMTMHEEGALTKGTMARHWRQRTCNEHGSLQQWRDDGHVVQFTRADSIGVFVFNGATMETVSGSRMLKAQVFSPNAFLTCFAPQRNLQDPENTSLCLDSHRAVPVKRHRQLLRARGSQSP